MANRTSIATPVLSMPRLEQNFGKIRLAKRDIASNIAGGSFAPAESFCSSAEPVVLSAYVFHVYVPGVRSCRDDNSGTTAQREPDLGNICIHGEMHCWQKCKPQRYV